MASVLFSTVGQALGGPLGGAVGAIAGSGLDAAFGPRRRGIAPEPGFPASSYAVPVSRLYGRTRTAGVLVWALPPTSGGGGKGGSGDRGGLVTSLAFALSARPVRDIGRIWADGRELRAADGAMAVQVSIRLHRGNDDPDPDPVIVAAEGFGRSPAFRNLAYVVLENLPLAGFGNRIPGLSFEVLADEEGDLPSAWIRDFCWNAGLDAQVPDGLTNVLGFASSAALFREDLMDLALLSGAMPGLSQGRLRVGGGGVAHAIDSEEPLAGGAAGDARGLTLSTALDARPAAWTLSYLDPDRDYQRGSQRAVSGEAGRQIASGAAVTLDASGARAAAERLLQTGRAAARHLELRLGWKWAHVAPGDTLTVSGVSGAWRVVERELSGLVVRLDCESIVADSQPSHAGDSGRALLAPAVFPGPTHLFLLEPPASIRTGAGPELLVVATGGAGWRGARVAAMTDGDGATAQAELRTRAIHGVTGTFLGAGPTSFWDEAKTLDIILNSADDPIEGRSRSAVLSGSNLLLVGQELLQYRDAQHLGLGRYRLGGLLRGRYLTHSVEHPVGEPWVLLSGAAVLSVALSSGWVDRTVRAEAFGAGDPVGGTATDWLITGASLAPLAPCHVALRRDPAGGIRLSFVLRDRRLLDWSAGPDPAPAGHIVHLRRLGSQGSGASWRVDGTVLDIGPAEMAAAFGAAIPGLSVRVEAIGDGPVSLRTNPDHHFPF